MNYIVTIPALAFGPASDLLRMNEEQTETFARLLKQGKSIVVETKPYGTIMRLSSFQLGVVLIDEEEKIAEMPYQAQDVVDVREEVFHVEPDRKHVVASPVYTDCDWETISEREEGLPIDRWGDELDRLIARRRAEEAEPELPF